LRSGLSAAEEWKWAGRFLKINEDKNKPAESAHTNGLQNGSARFLIPLPPLAAGKICFSLYKAKKKRFIRSVIIISRPGKNEGSNTMAIDREPNKRAQEI
jgi:hypothetical protein